MMPRIGAVGRAILIAIALIPAAGCGVTATEPATQLDVARTQWTMHAPAAYSLTITRSCECLVEMTGPVVVDVREGGVTSRRYVGTGAEVVVPYAELFPAVEGLFALIDEGIRGGTQTVEAQYHPVMGYPTRIVVGNPGVDAPVTSVIELRMQDD